MKRILPLMLLAACAAQELPMPLQMVDTCGAARYAELIGQDATALENHLLLGPVRVMRPGDMVTMDFLPDRVNFIIDADERIAQVDCG